MAFDLFANSNPSLPPANNSNVGNANPTLPPNPSTQNWNGQQIPTSIATKNLVSYDSATGNKTFKLPSQAGGGIYTEDKNGNLVKGGHTTYGGFAPKTGFERADTIPQALGGTNSNAGNIAYEPLLPTNQRSPGILTQSDKFQDQSGGLNAQVKNGVIQPKAAIAEDLSEQENHNFPNTNLPPKTTTSIAGNFLPALKDTLGNMFVKPAAELGVGAYNLGQGIGEAAEGKPIISPETTRTLPLGIGKITPPDPTNPSGALQVAGDTLNTAGEATALANPIDTATDIGSAFKNVGTGIGEKLGIGGADEAANMGSEVVKSGLPTNKTPEQKILNSRISDATPDYNPKMVGDNVKTAQGETVPRVNEAKTLGNRTVNTSASEAENGKELANIKDYPDKGTALQKSQAVDRAISTEAEGMRDNLQAEDKASPLDVKAEKSKVTDLVKSNLPKEIQDKIGYIGKDSPLSKVGIKDNPQTPLNKALQDAMSSSEDNLPKTAAGRYYQKVLDAADSYDGTREGKLNLRQSIDNAYKNARGKLAFGTDSQNALDETNTDIRNDINKDLKNSTNNINTQDSLDKQSRLYRAKDVLDSKATKEPSTFGGRHPFTTKLGNRLATGAAVGLGVGAATGGSFYTLGKNIVKGVENKIHPTLPTSKITVRRH